MFRVVGGVAPLRRGETSPAMSSHLNVVLGFSILAKGEAKMSSMYISTATNQTPFKYISKLHWYCTRPATNSSGLLTIKLPHFRHYGFVHVHYSVPQRSRRTLRGTFRVSIHPHRLNPFTNRHVLDSVNSVPLVSDIARSVSRAP
jgi:hypothetical protein